jgi:hypothetical protein
MKLRALTFLLGSLTLGGLHAQDSKTAEADTLPELPSVQPTKVPEGPEIVTSPQMDSTIPDVPQNTRRMPTAEELEQVRKDRNWMVEGMKEKQAEATATRLQDPGNTDMSQSIIDMVLDKQKQNKKAEARKTPQTKQNDGRTAAEPTTNSVNTFQPVISNNSFDNQMSVPSENNISNSILQKERAEARKAGFIPPGTAPTLDPLANPFANLPIAEAALPQPNPRNSMMPATTPTVTNSAMTSNNGNLAMMSGNMPSAAGLGKGPDSGNPGAPAAYVANNPGPSAPVVAVEQPYTILREQELITRQQKLNSNRPRAQDLRSTVPDPNDARLF